MTFEKEAGRRLVRSQPYCRGVAGHPKKDRVAQGRDQASGVRRQTGDRRSARGDTGRGAIRVACRRPGGVNARPGKTVFPGVEASVLIDRGVRISDAQVMGDTHSGGPAERDAPDVRAAQLGDHAAFAALHGRFARMVHGLLLARVPVRDVDDLVQDVFLTAFQRLADLREPEAFGGWLAAIARRRAVDYFRSAKPTTGMGETDPVGSDGRRMDEALAVLGAIQQLPEAYRETLVLRLVEGMTGPEIADRTGLTPGSVRVNLHRGMLRLREILRGERGML